MGILGFQKWLLGSFPQIVRVQTNKHGQQYDHVAFDMNQVIHQSARRARNREALVALLFRELDHILKNCIPQKSVFFAFDGPGPLAKLITQRKRRNKSKKGHTTVKDDGKESKYAISTIDRLEFTPGVDLVYYLRDMIKYWAYSRLQNDRKYRNVDIRVSGADVPGEGELKIIDFCRAAQLHETESVIVIGGDADIVLQGLATTPMRNFFVYLRHFAKVNGKRVNYVISVWELARILERHFPGESSGARLDFILLAILNGNDYIPKIRGVSLGRTWRRYLSLKLSGDGNKEAPFKGQLIVDAEKRTFNWQFLHALIDKVGVPVRPVEQELRAQQSALDVAANTLSDVGSSHVASDGQSLIALDNSTEIADDRIVYTGNEDGVPMEDEVEWHGLDDDNEDVLDPLIDCDTESDESGELTDDEIDEAVDAEQAHIENLVAITGNSTKFYDTERFFRALLWTLHMYIDGFCSDYTFQYAKPYGPSCDVLSKYIKDHNGDPFVIQAPVANTSPLRPYQAAAAMLPRHAVHLLPKPVQQVVQNPALSKRLFLPKDEVNIFALVQAIDEIPLSAYSETERQRLECGLPFLLRRPIRGDFCPRANAPVPRPGPKFEQIRAQPVIYYRNLRATDAPPCHAWPSGSTPGMLNLPYVQVGGLRLQRPRSNPAESNVAGPAPKVASSKKCAGQIGKGPVRPRNAGTMRKNLGS